MKCPCESGKDFSDCCEPVIKGEVQAQTAEQLMRARYTAYSQGQMTFIRSTLAPEARRDFNLAEAEKWSRQSEWHGLKILKTEAGGASDSKGVVEFVATYTAQGETIEHHEVAKFRRMDGKWFFVDGDSHVHRGGEGHHHHHVEQVIREAPKVGRNDPCTCGSGKKFKKCCGANE